MRRVILVAGLLLAVGLSACDSAKDDTSTLAVPTKSMARSQQMYQGQELIAKVDTASISVKDGVLQMQATGSVPSAGYKNAGFLPKINAAPPKDGVYEVDAVADRPATPGAQVVTPVDVKGAWPNYPKDHLKGVKIFAKGNSVVAMLPAG
jgi:hypothetical protein